MTKTKTKTKPISQRALMRDFHDIQAELKRRGVVLHLICITDKSHGVKPGIYLPSAGPCETEADKAAIEVVEAAAKAVGVKWTGR